MAQLKGLKLVAVLTAPHIIAVILALAAILIVL
jgi:hypothetical protein